MLNRLMGGAAKPPSEEEMAAMQAELGRLDPKAIEELPKELKEALPKGLSGLGGALPRLPGLGVPGLGVPGLGARKLPGLPGKKK
jgi:signal recognition particle subunit SRP54